MNAASLQHESSLVASLRYGSDYTFRWIMREAFVSLSTLLVLGALTLMTKIPVIGALVPLWFWGVPFGTLIAIGVWVACTRHGTGGVSPRETLKPLIFTVIALTVISVVYYDSIVRFMIGPAGFRDGIILRAFDGSVIDMFYLSIIPMLIVSLDLGWHKME